MGEQVSKGPKPSPIEETYAHLEQTKRILEEWEKEEKALEAKQASVKNTTNS